MRGRALRRPSLPERRVTHIDEPTTAEQELLPQRSKRARRLDEQNGVLDPSQRYRALVTTLKQETDFLDLADKKARFALVIMGVLNALVVVLAVKGRDGLTGTGLWARALQAEVAIYALCAIYYIAQAIEALRPRGGSHRPRDVVPAEVVPGASMRVIFHSDIARRTREEYRDLWNSLRLDNLVAELADEVHMVATINVTKYVALGQLYQGLVVMTSMVLAMLVTIAATLWV